jgi:hypothetical protein
MLGLAETVTVIFLFDCRTELHYQEESTLFGYSYCWEYSYSVVILVVHPMDELAY